MRRRRKQPDRVSHERWLVSYADFITLLFAFFVVLYASSQVDKRKVGQLALAIQVAFQKLGIFDASNTKPETTITEPMPFSHVQMVENAERYQSLDRLVNSPHGDLTKAPVRKDMDMIEKKLQDALAAEIKKHTLSVTPTREGIVVSLHELGFFDSGSTTLRPGTEQTLSDFVRVVAPFRVRVRIEGHTDNVPIHTARFDSNWELSTARATEMIKLFISKYHVPPELLSASGYGEYYPVASNDTAEGRGLNRRVDLVILNSAADSSSPLPERQVGTQPDTATHAPD
ncbi:MAG: OmpA family protein [Acidobacteriia bacterium]|nr:OmpA family protein [Terriglobia bacterium]